APFNIVRGNQTILFDPPTEITYGDPPTELTASTSSGLSVSYTASGVCTISGNILTATAIGICTVTANQAGDESYYPAPSVTRDITVGKHDQKIIFGSLPNQILGSPPFNVTATASSGLPVSFSAAGACSVTNGLVRLQELGNCTIVASQAGDTYYNAAASVARTFVVQKLGYRLYVPVVMN